MFIALVQFPDVPIDRDTEFQDWFAWSNQQLAGAAGLRGRRLLRATDGGYRALVEHDSTESFAAMHSAPVVEQIQARLHEIVPEPPRATQFDVIFGTVDEGCCAKDDYGHDDEDARSAPEADSRGVALGHACCHGS